MGTIFRKNFENFVDLFLGWPFGFPSSTKNTINTLFCENCLQRRRIYKKNWLKGRYENFFLKVWLKKCVFWRASLQFSKGRLLILFELGQPKMDIINLYQRGTLWKNLATRIQGEGWDGQSLLPPPPPLPENITMSSAKPFSKPCLKPPHSLRPHLNWPSTRSSNLCHPILTLVFYEMVSFQKRKLDEITFSDTEKLIFGIRLVN